MGVRTRDVTIDIVRSIAITIMVAANMAVIASGEPVFAFRFLASMAAPIFITLANMMVILGIMRGHSVSSSIIRCVFLFFVAALFDLSNGLIPLTYVDVLYLIGLSLVLTACVGRLSTIYIVMIAAAILMITPILVMTLGYNVKMHYELSGLGLYGTLDIMSHQFWHRYLVDGWFPLFPWLSIGLFGAILGKLRYGSGQVVSFATSKYVVSAFVLIFLGALLYCFDPSEHYIRYGYIELFYPPDSPLMIIAMGVVLGTISFIDSIGDVGIWAVLHPIGEASLFMYLFHIAVIEHIILPLGSITFGMRYFIYYLCLLTVMIGIGYLLRWIRNTAYYRLFAPHFVRWIVG